MGEADGIAGDGAVRIDPQIILFKPDAFYVPSLLFFGLGEIGFFRNRLVLIKCFLCFDGELLLYDLVLAVFGGLGCQTFADVRLVHLEEFDHGIDRRLQIRFV